MKILKLMPFVLLAALAAANYSCSKDDDVEGSAPTPGTAIDEMPTYADLGVEYPIVRVYGGGGPSMNYSSGRLTGGSYSEFGGDYEVLSTPLRFVFSRDASGSSYSSYTYSNIRVNEAGYVVYMELDYDDGEHDTFTITYNDDCRMSEVVARFAYNEPGYSESGLVRNTFNWDGGRLMTREEYEEYTWTEDGYTEAEAGGCTMTYEFASDYPNTGVYYVNDNDILPIGTPLIYSGLFGKPADFLPTSETSYEYDIVDGEKDIYYGPNKRQLRTGYENGRVRNHDDLTIVYLGESGVYYAPAADAVSRSAVQDDDTDRRPRLARRAARQAARR